MAVRPRQHRLVLREAAPAVEAVPLAHARRADRRRSPGGRCRACTRAPCFAVVEQVADAAQPSTAAASQLGSSTGNAGAPRQRGASAGASPRLRPAALHQQAAAESRAGAEQVVPAAPCTASACRPRAGARARVSKSGTCSLSCQIHGVATRGIWNSTSRMWPVSPMPPSVARKSSRSCSSLSTRSMRPSATRMRSEPHVLAEAAGDVVVLAVHVGGHHAAEGDVMRARRHRREPAARQKNSRFRCISATPGLGAHRRRSRDRRRAGGRRAASPPPARRPAAAATRRRTSGRGRASAPRRR